MVTDPELIDDFINWQRHLYHLTDATIRNNRATLTAWARFLSTRGGRNCLRYADTESVVAYIDNRKTDGVKDATISGALCILRTFYNYLIHFGGTTNPTGSLPAFVCNNNYEGEYLTTDVLGCRSRAQRATWRAASLLGHGSQPRPVDRQREDHRHVATGDRV